MFNAYTDLLVWEKGREYLSAHETMVYVLQHMRQWCMCFRKGSLYNEVGEYFSPDPVLRHRGQLSWAQGPWVLLLWLPDESWASLSPAAASGGPTLCCGYLPAPSPPLFSLILAHPSPPLFPFLLLGPSSWETGPFPLPRRPLETWTSVYLLALELLRICAVQRAWVSHGNPSATAGRGQKWVRSHGPARSPVTGPCGQELLSRAVLSCADPSTAVRPWCLGTHWPSRVGPLA